MAILKRLPRIILIISIIFLIFVLRLNFIEIYSNVSHMDFIYQKKTKKVKFEYNLEDCPYQTAWDIKWQLDKTFGTNLYFYQEVDSLPFAATTNVPFRLIKIQKYYTNYDYIYTFFMAHELTHLRYYVGNEMWTNYTAVITLYESNDTWFKNVALWYAEYLINSQLGDEYDCGWYLVNYFEKEIKINESLC